MNKLSEIKALAQQVLDKATEFELLEEARRRGYKNGVRCKRIYGDDEFIIREPLQIVICSNNHERDIYNSRSKEWAEIIPKQKGMNILSKYAIASNNDKSLHDQIREGGWPFVCKKAGKQYMTLLISGDVPSLQQEKDCLGQKVSAYTMLLALSKVLNEGKEKGQEIYTVSFKNHNNKLIVTGHLDMYPAIEIYNHDDATFALEFAEKEWKCFYNQE